MKVVIDLDKINRDYDYAVEQCSLLNNILQGKFISTCVEDQVTGEILENKRILLDEVIVDGFANIGSYFTISNVSDGNTYTLQSKEIEVIA